MAFTEDNIDDHPAVYSAITNNSTASNSFRHGRQTRHQQQDIPSLCASTVVALFLGVNNGERRCRKTEWDANGGACHCQLRSRCKPSLVRPVTNHQVVAMLLASWGPCFCCSRTRDRKCQWCVKESWREKNKDHFDAGEESLSQATLDSCTICTGSLGMFPNWHNVSALNIGTFPTPSQHCGTRF